MLIAAVNDLGLTGALACSSTRDRILLQVKKLLPIELPVYQILPQSHLPYSVLLPVSRVGVVRCHMISTWCTFLS